MGSEETIVQMFVCDHAKVTIQFSGMDDVFASR